MSFSIRCWVVGFVKHGGSTSFSLFVPKDKPVPDGDLHPPRSNSFPFMVRPFSLALRLFVAMYERATCCLQGAGRVSVIAGSPAPGARGLWRDVGRRAEASCLMVAISAHRNSGRGGIQAYVFCVADLALHLTTTAKNLH